ncbi:MAG: hypothetical protein U9O53_01655 [archaeon]|nr:hypothetical protein [archaeon]
MNYKITSLEVPEETEIINDGSYRYLLYGTTDDFYSFKLADRSYGAGQEKSDAEMEAESLSLSKGIVLPYRGSVSIVLDRSRAVCTKDGRIFVEEGMINDKKYLDAIGLLIEDVRETFEDPKLVELYKEYAKS